MCSSTGSGQEETRDRDPVWLAEGLESRGAERGRCSAFSCTLSVRTQPPSCSQKPLLYLGHWLSCASLSQWNFDLPRGTLEDPPHLHNRQQFPPNGLIRPAVSSGQIPRW